MIVIAVKNGCHDHHIIRQLLNNMGNSYIEIGEKSKKPLLPNDVLHRNLLDALMRIKFISSYKVDKDDKFLRVHPTKITYIGFTK